MKMGICALILIGLAGLAPGSYADDYPQGCVDCHVKTDSLDFRLNFLLEQIGHRRIKRLKNIPRDCGRFGGDCRHCHTMDAEAGEAALKNGPKNW
jgi:hypothetical protein